MKNKITQMALAALPAAIVLATVARHRLGRTKEKPRLKRGLPLVSERIGLRRGCHDAWRPKSL